MTRKNALMQVAEALLMDYSSIYYVNTRTNEYQWYSFNPRTRTLELEKEGEDFFANMARDALKAVHEEDRHIFTEDLTKKKLLDDLRRGAMQSIEYRLVIDGRPVYHALRLIREVIDDEDYLILGVLNIDREVRERQAAETLQRERQVYTQVAERLALNYDAIYYVDVDTCSYITFISGDIYGSADLDGLREDGEDFFAASRRDAGELVHPDDRDALIEVLDRNYLIEALAGKRVFTIEYNLLIDDRPQRTRMTVMWSNDRTHFIVCAENIEKEFRRELEQNRALQSANVMARTDDLTGVKNKHAYHEFEDNLERSLHSKDPEPFAIVVCDVNGLKDVNDTRGHKEGDDYLIRSCRMICKVYAHSPVFRIGGDEFTVILTKKDYRRRDDLLELMRQQVWEHLKNQDGPVMASGMAVFDAEKHRSVSDVFREADELMYEEKHRLKSGIPPGEGQPAGASRIIPEDRRQRLDEMFSAFETVADGTYVFVCDMKHDYSRWSEAAIEAFALPSNYMYDAGYIWERRIHPDDRSGYHRAMEGIFFGEDTTFNMQYRALNAQGDYVGCTCRGTVLRDRNGDADYFCGAIRNHGIREQIDITTGLRNQYGFFEDLTLLLHKKQKATLCMVGISRFSELNDVYGYHFGNRLLRKVGRYLFEHVGNDGEAYRLDGPKFALITHTRSNEELRFRYERLRALFRDGFYVDDHYIILEINGGIMNLDSFDIDDRTVYACLSYAYGESKNIRQGDLVAFRNYLGEDSRERIEKIQEIRASITRKCENFYLVYQPVVDAASERLYGAEVLLRWGNDVYGIVPPDEFIDVIERDSLFPELGRWILRTALLEAAPLLDDHPDFNLSVNLSYTQVGRPGFVDSVIGILEETGFPADHLCLEITERCRLLDTELLTNVVAALRSRGIRVALDDFGTGFSSASLLQALPLDVIKIDRSFVRNIETDPSAGGLIRNFAEMASVCGASVCVEGVENENMRRILLDYAVDRLQGYHYSKPVPIDDFRRWTKGHERRLSSKD